MLFHPFLLPFLFPLTYRKRKYTSSAQCSGLCILKKHSGSFETAAFLHSSFRWFREESNWSLKRLLSCSICRLKMQRAWNLLLLSCVCSHCCMSTALWDRLHWDRFSLITWKLFLLPAHQFVCTITRLSCTNQNTESFSLGNYSKLHVIPHPCSFQTPDSPESRVTGRCFSLHTNIYPLTRVTRFGGNVKSGDFSYFCISSLEHEYHQGDVFLQGWKEEKC